MSPSTLHCILATHQTIYIHRCTVPLDIALTVHSRNSTLYSIHKIHIPGIYIQAYLASATWRMVSAWAMFSSPGCAAGSAWRVQWTQRGSEIEDIELCTSKANTTMSRNININCIEYWCQTVHYVLVQSGTDGCRAVGVAPMTLITIFEVLHNGWSVELHTSPPKMCVKK